eukprot:1181155-Prorocentrum_minimum.AAC.3
MRRTLSSDIRLPRAGTGLSGALLGSHRIIMIMLAVQLGEALTVATRSSRLDMHAVGVPCQTCVANLDCPLHLSKQQSAATFRRLKLRSTEIFRLSASYLRCSTLGFSKP